MRSKAGSTANLHSHLKLCHFLKYTELTSKMIAFSTPSLTIFAVNDPDNSFFCLLKYVVSYPVENFNLK